MIINNFNILVDKLRAYSNRSFLFYFIRGIFYLVSIALLILLGLLLFEYYTFSTANTRKFLVLIYLLFLVVISVVLLFPSLLYLLKIKKRTLKEDALFVSKHSTQLDDKLLNIVELKEGNYENESLVLASIAQKTELLPSFSFSDFKAKYRIKKSAITFSFSLVLFVILFLSCSLSEPLYRLYHYNSEFSKEQPFTIELQNNNLHCFRGDDYTISVIVEGFNKPENVFIKISGTEYLMSGELPVFNYTINSVQRALSFSFTSGDYTTEVYELQVSNKPLITDYKLTITPPSYTALPAYEQNNVGDVTCPFGSEINFSFNTLYTDSLSINFADSLLEVTKDLSSYRANYKVFKPSNYTVYTHSKESDYIDSLNYVVDIIADEYPKINLVQSVDSTFLTRHYFKGAIVDDYGFNKLKFELKAQDFDSIIDIPIVKNLRHQEFYFFFDFEHFKERFSTIDYSFSITDNDYFNGYKCSYTSEFSFSFPTEKEIEEHADNLMQELDSLMNEGNKINNSIARELASLYQKNQSGELTEHDKNQYIKSIIDKKEELNSTLQNISDVNKQLNNYNSSFTQQRKDILEKQSQIQNLLDEMMNAELESLFDELNNLAEDFDPASLNQLMDNIQMPLSDLSKQLDKNLEMLNRMKLEQDISNMSDNLSELAQDIKEASDSFDKKDNSAQEKIDKISDRFDELSDKYESLKEKEKELEKPFNLPDLDDEIQDTKKSIDDVKEQHSSQTNKQTQKQLDQISQNISNMSDKINNKMGAGGMSMQMENLENLKRIIKNLITISLSQEELILETENAQGASSALHINEIQFNQEKIIRQTNHISDSLFSLSTRLPVLSMKFTQEIYKLNTNHNEIIAQLREGRLYNVPNLQQKSMMAFNELALFLNDVLQRLEDMMQNSQGDGKSSSSSKNNKDGMQQMKNMQKSMKEQLKQMIDALKNGNKQQISQMMGKSLKMQEMMQQMINEMMMDDSFGSTAKQELSDINSLIEHNKQEILSNKVNSRTIDRQNKILDKLLKAEKAETERDEDKERKSDTAKKLFYENPTMLFNSDTIRNGKVDDIYYDDIKLKFYYQNIYRDYIEQIKSN